MKYLIIYTNKSIKKISKKEINQLKFLYKTYINSSKKIKDLFNLKEVIYFNINQNKQLLNELKFLFFLNNNNFDFNKKIYAGIYIVKNEEFKLFEI